MPYPVPLDDVVHGVGCFEAIGKSACEALKRNGFDARILSVGSTGTYNIDSQIAGVTELQCGSYAFMDVDYRSIGSRSGNKTYDDFQPSLTVITTVVNVAENRVSVDAEGWLLLHGD